MALWRPPTAANRTSAPRARVRCPCCGDWFAPQLTLVEPGRSPHQACQWCGDLESGEFSEHAFSN